MICNSENIETILKPNMFGGEGTAQLKELFKKGQYWGKSRLIGIFTLPPGTSVGEHVHNNDEEFIYILSGDCMYFDNGKTTTLKAGDAALTRGGESHAIYNNGNEDCTYLAIILMY